MKALRLGVYKKGIVTDDFPSGSEAAAVEFIGHQLEARIKKLFGRSLAIREVDAGSCNGCEVEVNSLSNSVHDLERFGLHIVASPRHADVLLVTGPVTRNMEGPLQKTFDATPEPKIVIALGDCAADGGIFSGSYAVVGGVGKVLPVDLFIPGCPPRPNDILAGILAALNKMPRKK